VENKNNKCHRIVGVLIVLIDVGEPFGNGNWLG